MATIASRFDPIQSDFDAALKVLRDILTHVGATRPSPQLRLVLLNNTIVALTAAIEETLRGAFKEYLTILEEEIVDQRRLHESLQTANYKCAIHALTITLSDRSYGDAERLVTNLAKCLTGQPGYELQKDALTYNQGNFKSKQVTDIAKYVGMNNLWREICDSTEMETFTGESNVDARVTRITAQWNDIFEERDTVVHRVSQARGWAEERISKAIDLSKLVVARVSSCLASNATAQIAKVR